MESYEKQGKAMEKLWKSYGKAMEGYEKVMEKQWESYGKAMGSYAKAMQKQWQAVKAMKSYQKAVKCHGNNEKQ